VSSRVDWTTGEVVISAPVYASMPVGHRLAIIGSPAEGSRRSSAVWDDFVARLTLSRSGHANHIGVSVRADEAELMRAIENGSLHPSLVEQPHVNGEAPQGPSVGELLDAA
jgi:hypothetical protein